MSVIKIQGDVLYLSEQWYELSVGGSLKHAKKR